jgi:hypothetical protein
VGREIVVPLLLSRCTLLGRALGIFPWIEVGPATPARQITAVEKWREARRRLGGTRKGASHQK